MGVIERVAVIRNKLQPLRVLVDSILEGAPDITDEAPLVVDSNKALNEIVDELVEIVREARATERSGEPAFIVGPESKL